MSGWKIGFFVLVVIAIAAVAYGALSQLKLSEHATVGLPTSTCSKARSCGAGFFLEWTLSRLRTLFQLAHLPTACSATTCFPPPSKSSGCK
jgi:hypothetical protein